MATKLHSNGVSYVGVMQGVHEILPKAVEYMQRGAKLPFVPEIIPELGPRLAVCPIAAEFQIREEATARSIFHKVDKPKVQNGGVDGHPAIAGPGLEILDLVLWLVLSFRNVKVCDAILGTDV